MNCLFQRIKHFFIKINIWKSTINKPIINNIDEYENRKKWQEYYILKELEIKKNDNNNLA